MTVLRPLTIGTLLSGGATAGISALDPVPATLPHLSANHPWQAYVALADSTFGNGWELFALIAVIMSACLFVWGLYRAGRAASQRDEGRAA